MAWALRRTDRLSPKGKPLYVHNFFGGGLKTFQTKGEAEAFVLRMQRSNLEAVEIELKKEKEPS